MREYKGEGKDEGKMLTSEVKEGLVIYGEDGNIPKLSSEQKKYIVSELLKGKSLVDIQRENDDIDDTNIFNEFLRDEEFHNTYVKIRKYDTEKRVSDILRYSEDETKQYGTRYLYTQNLKWYAAKMFPKLYGDKLQIDKKEDKTVKLVIEKQEKAPKTIDLEP